LRRGRKRNRKRKLAGPRKFPRNFSGTLFNKLVCLNSSSVKRFFSAEEEIVVGIVRNFRLTTGSGSPIGDVRLALEKMFVPPEVVDVVLQQALGWIKQKTDSLLEKGQPAAIGYDEFKTEITAFVRKCSAREILVSWAGKPSAEDVEGDLLRTYVQQLELINCDDDEKFRSINDFLLASVDRTNWSKAGLIHRSSFENFETALVAFWKNKRRQTEIIHKKRVSLTVESFCTQTAARTDALLKAWKFQIISPLGVSTRWPTSRRLDGIRIIGRASARREKRRVGAQSRECFRS
jgi:hypothetical protein